MLVFLLTFFVVFFVLVFLIGIIGQLFFPKAVQKKHNSVNSC